MFITVTQVGTNGNTIETEIAIVAIAVREPLLREYADGTAPDRRRVGAQSVITLQNGRRIEVLETLAQVRAKCEGRQVERETVVAMTSAELPLSLAHLSDCLCPKCKANHWDNVAKTGAERG